VSVRYMMAYLTSSTSAWSFKKQRFGRSTHGTGMYAESNTAAGNDGEQGG